MGAMRKAGVWLGLIEDEDDRHYDGHGYDDDFEEEVDEAPVSVRPRAAAAERLAEARETGRAERSAVRAISRPSSATTTYPTRDNLALAPQVQLRERAVVTEDEERRYQITTLHPTTYNEARTIGEHFRDGVPVIMNLTEMAEADATRLVD